jgi:hypothetical protein
MKRSAYKGLGFSSGTVISVLAQWLIAAVNDFAGIGIFHLFEIMFGNGPAVDNPALLHELLEFAGPMSTEE